jgi:hypothetical protein
MDFSISNGLTDSLYALRQARASQAYVSNPKPKTAEDDDNAQLPALIPSARGKTSGTQLLNEQREDLDNGGYRVTRTFEKEDGRTFTKVEEFALTERGSRKTVIQQNPSGSFTRYEEVLDREDSGNFRRTQRFQEAGGDVTTSITTDFKVTDAFILTGGQRAQPVSLPLPFSTSRGTQLDLQA